MSSSRRREPMFTQRGVALIAVTVAAAIVGVLVTEFSTNTNVDQRAARNAEAELKAHFLARSSMNISQLMIRLQTQVVDRMGGGAVQIADYAPMIMAAFGGGPEEIAALGEMVGGVSGDLKGLGVPEGSFDVAISTDDAKINVNCAGGPQQVKDNLEAQLSALVYFDAYNPIFENADAQGWRRDRETQVAAIIDYIDTDQSRYTRGVSVSGAPEDYGYETQRDRYEAKNNYLDTISELRLVRGVDDRFWALFGEAFTIYGACLINIMAIQDPGLIAGIIFLSAKDRNDPAASDAQNLWMLAHLVLEVKKLATGVGVSPFNTLQDFASFVKAPLEELQRQLGGLDPAQMGMDPALLSMLAQVKGVELDEASLSTVATVGPRRTYRVEATALLGHMTKRIVGVWDRQAPNNQNTRTPGNQESREQGAWVYWRED